jgi:hypothetical protein
LRRLRAPRAVSGPSRMRPESQPQSSLLTLVSDEDIAGGRRNGDCATGHPPPPPPAEAANDLMEPGSKVSRQGLWMDRTLFRARWTAPVRMVNLSDRNWMLTSASSQSGGLRRWMVLNPILRNSRPLWATARCVTRRENETEYQSNQEFGGIHFRISSLYGL